MKFRHRLLALACVMGVAACPVARAQARAAAPETVSPPPVPAVKNLAAASPAPADPEIVAAIAQVSAARIRASDERLVSFYNRSTLSASDAAAVATGKGIGAAREWIRQQFESYSRACNGCLQVKVQDYVQQPGERIAQPTTIANVYAILPGADPENARRIYLVTGHYDSRNSDNFNTTGAAPGANDDASGTAVSLECARVLSQHKFPATLIFLTVAGEEQGLYGSKNFARWAKSQGMDIAGVLNNDIVGGNSTPGDTLQRKNVVRVFSEGLPAAATEPELRRIRALGGESDSPSRQLARAIAEIAVAYFNGSFAPILVFRPDRYLRGGDHTSFNEQGFAAVRFTEFREDYNHQHQNVRTENGIEYGDLGKFVDFEYVASVARLNLAALAALASAPGPPRNVRLGTKQLENRSTLTWEPPAGGMATGYEVVIRATSSPLWQYAAAAGDGLTATIDQSKDNVVFGVRSIDGKGHRSVAVFPLPQP